MCRITSDIHRVFRAGLEYKNYLNLSRLHSVRMRRVMEIVVAEGTGTAPDDPIREVTYYYDLEGNYLAHHDREGKVKPWLKLKHDSPEVLE